MGIYIIITVLIIIVCILLGFIVLIQNPKGGGLGATFGGAGNQMFGAARSADFVERATWYLAIFLIVLSLMSAATIRTNTGNTGPAPTEQSVIESNGVILNPGNVQQPGAAPAAQPAPVPAGDGNDQGQ